MSVTLFTLMSVISIFQSAPLQFYTVPVLLHSLHFLYGYLKVLYGPFALF
jgi:hypothetical protein